MSVETDPGFRAGPLDTVLGRVRQWPDWVVLLPLAVLVAAILVLALYTTKIHRQTRALRQETATIFAPALRASQDLIMAVALEQDELYQYVLTGNTGALASYRRNTAERRRAIATLEPLARRLDGEALRHSFRLLTLVEDWDAAVPDPSELPGLGPTPRERRLDEIEALFREILIESTALQRVLRTGIDSERADIDAAERLDWYFTLILAALALCASFLVFWLVRRVRRLADISEVRRLELEAAMYTRARLIRGITHDVKNPLNAADGSAQTLEMSVGRGMTEAQLEMVHRIRRSIGAALGILSDLLELSQAEAGRLEINVVPTNLSAILQEAADDYHFQAEAGGLSLTLEVPAALPHPITDGARVREVIGNLLSNAVKYTPAGGHVTLSARVAETRAPLTGRRIGVSVSDTGPGIRPEEREKIFEEFYRAHVPGGRATGVGLGLAISRRIARLLGGDLTVESEPGHGSTFTLWLPLDQAALRPRAA